MRDTRARFSLPHGEGAERELSDPMRKISSDALLPHARHAGVSIGAQLIPAKDEQQKRRLGGSGASGA